MAAAAFQVPASVSPRRADMTDDTPEAASLLALVRCCRDPSIRV